MVLNMWMKCRVFMCQRGVSMYLKECPPMALSPPEKKYQSFEHQKCFNLIDISTVNNDPIYKILEVIESAFSVHKTMIF